jgi:imidazolonepropionase-like amidohydrolase
MLDELRAAYTTGQMTPAQIFRAVTIDAAKLLRLPDVGVLRPGYRADFLIVPATDEPDPYRRLIALTLHEISAVYMDGTPRFGSHEIFNYFGIRVNAK